jgi:hypothetical protein
LGWDINVYRQLPDGEPDRRKGGRPVSTWQAEVEGLRWIDELVAKGVATPLTGNGYPYRGTVRVDALVDVVRDGLHHVKHTSLGDSAESISRRVDSELSGLYPSEWLLLDIWDQS